MAQNICIYHANCVDGVGAAFAVWYHQAKLGLEFDFIPTSYGKNWRDVIGDYYDLNINPSHTDPQNYECWIVDFSFPKDQLLEMADTFKSVVVLDHHKSAKEDCETIIAPPNLDILFDMKRSGAGIAWDYCSNDTERPKLINFIEDRDLWKFKYNLSKAIHMGLADFKKFSSLTEMDFENFAAFLNETVLEQSSRTWQAQLEYHNARVEEVARTAIDGQFLHEVGSYSVKLINCPYFMASDMGEHFRDQCDFSVMYNIDLLKKSVAISLRSKKVDVSALAKQYFNGGGHHNAAGGWLPLKDFFKFWHI